MEIMTGHGIYGDEWGRKGATLSDKTARSEFGLTQDEIFTAIDAGKLHYRPAAMHGNPWLRLLRREVEDLVRTRTVTGTCGNSRRGPNWRDQPRAETAPGPPRRLRRGGPRSFPNSASKADDLASCPAGPGLPRLARRYPADAQHGSGVQFAPGRSCPQDPGEVPVGRTDRGASLPVRRPLFRGCVRPGQRPHFTRPEPWRNGRRPADCTPRRVLRRLRRAPFPGRLSRSAQGRSQLSCAPLPPHQPQTGFNEWHSLPVLLGREPLSLRCRG